jgi:AraC-like DNA-binding protein
MPDRIPWKRINDAVEALGEVGSIGDLVHAALRSGERVLPTENSLSLNRHDGFCVASSGKPEMVQRSYNEHFRHAMDFMPIPWDRTYEMGTREFKINDYRSISHTEFANDFAFANGIYMSLIDFSPRQRFSLCIMRGRGEKAFTKVDCESMSILNRHINNFIALHERLQYAPGISELLKTEAEAGRSPRPAPRRSGSNLSPSRAERYLHKLEGLMTMEKPYLDPDLTLGRLARELSMPRNLLSELINRYLGMSFPDYINSRRIGEARRLLSERTRPITILQVAYDAGFNSKSVFYENFRELVGTSPTDYIASLPK